MIIYFNYFLNSGFFLKKNATTDRIFYGEHDTSEFGPSFKPDTKSLSVQRKHLSFTKLTVNVVARYTYLLRVSNCCLQHVIWHRRNHGEGRCIIKVNSPVR